MFVDRQAELAFLNSALQRKRPTVAQFILLCDRRINGMDMDLCTPEMGLLGDDRQPLARYAAVGIRSLPGRWAAGRQSRAEEVLS